MIKQYNGAKAQRRAARELLPAGGYVAKILDAQVQHYDFRNGDSVDKLILSFDISEGVYTGFFKRDYNNNTNEDRKWRGVYRYLNIPKDDGSEQDGWTKRKFKTFTNAVEDSNSGYAWNWDETTLKGKLFGALYREKEFEGTSGDVITTTECGGSTDIASIRSGDFRLPKDKLLERPATVNNAYAAVPDDDLPF